MRYHYGKIIFIFIVELGFGKLCAQTNALNPTGNAGVGTTIPNAKLEVQSGYQYSGSTCVGTVGLHLRWSLPNMIPIPLPTNMPNALEVRGFYTGSGGGGQADFFVIDGRGRAAFGGVPDGHKQLTVVGNSTVRGNLMLSTGAATTDVLLSVNGAGWMDGRLQIGNTPGGYASDKLVVDGSVSLNVAGR